MNKQTKNIIGIAAIGLVAFLVYKQMQKPKANFLPTPKKIRRNPYISYPSDKPKSNFVSAPTPIRCPKGYAAVYNTVKGKYECIKTNTTTTIGGFL